MIIQFGLETEVGITRDGDSHLDVVAESIDLVRQAREYGIVMQWDYRCEDPHRDMRGFRVDSLRQDTDEANYLDQDTQRELSFSEIKSDIALFNGGRFYNDHAHPEYCTPECGTLEQLSAHDRAGEQILAKCAQSLTRQRSSLVRLYKNNTDYFGHSYGCHENYLISRRLPWENLCRTLEAFLVTRQVFAGAGKYATELEDQWIDGRFQISQRSDFFSVRQSVDTMQRRPIINTRDEPHANPEKYRRLHVILGDANMSPFATRLKVGSTAILLSSLQIAWERQESNPEIQFQNPIESLKSISMDTELQAVYPMVGSKSESAVSIQRHYHAWCEPYLKEIPESLQSAWRDWGLVLDLLEQRNWQKLRTQLDWIAKRCLIEEFRDSEGLEETDPWLQSLDLEYHRIDFEEGLYYDLERNGMMEGAPDPLSAQAAETLPPDESRAWVRGRLIEKFRNSVKWVQWDHVLLNANGNLVRVDLTDLFAEEAIWHYKNIIDRAHSVEELNHLMNP